MCGEELAFVAAINSAPGDDTPRLVMADWLDDHDRPERAAFIRVQCELARLLDGWKPETWGCLDMYLDPQSREDQEWKHRVWDMWKRERGLLDAAAVGDWAGYPGYVTEWWWERGFVGKIRLSAADFLANADALCWRPGLTAECRGCEGSGWFRYYHPAEIEKLDTCERCGTPEEIEANVQATGRVPRPCPPTAQPIEKVVLTTSDRLAYWSGPSGLEVTHIGGRRIKDHWPWIEFEVRGVELPPRDPLSQRGATYDDHAVGPTPEEYARHMNPRRMDSP